MKHNVKGQILFFSVSAVLLVFSLLIGFGIIDFGKKETLSENNPVSEPVFVLDTGLDDNIFQVGLSDNEYSESEQENIGIYEALNKAVVNITTEKLSLNWFLEPVPTDGGTGSGSIIDNRGYILTNYHVVKDVYKLFINLYDGSQFEAEVIGQDPENDLAVIKFNPGEFDLTTISFGTSNNLKVGQKVLAIGNPFGYDRTLTTGIVSGLSRPVRTSRNLIIQGMIQTDASINPGNSGGPLLDSKGRMIGINTMIYTPSGGSVGIGFAVPVDTAKRVVPDLISDGRVNRGWIDIYPVQLEPNIVRYGKLPVSKGILVSRLDSGSNAANAGIRGGDLNKPVQYGRSVIYFGGDIIVNIDGLEINTLEDLFSALEDNKPGESVEIDLIRGKRNISTTVILTERPEELLAE
jgi:S1-C subfamily serine protease